MANLTDVIPSEVEESRDETETWRRGILRLRCAPLRMTAFEKLCEIVAKLRAPGGCPWDREQTNESLVPALIEEAYEVAEAARAKDDAHFREELGDLLLLVVMHSEIASETGRFNIAEVIREVSDKLVRRHPHVFGSGDARDSGAVLKQWEAIKREEKKPDAHYLLAQNQAAARAAQSFVGGRGDKISVGHRAGVKARRHQAGNVRDVVAKVDEEVREMKQAIASEKRAAIQDEIGDLLFAVVNLARKCSIDAESTLQSAIEKFVRRFNFVEDELRSRGKRLGDVDLAEMDAIWNAIKKNDEAHE